MVVILVVYKYKYTNEKVVNFRKDSINMCKKNLVCLIWTLKISKCSRVTLSERLFSI